MAETAPPQRRKISSFFKRAVIIFIVLFAALNSLHRTNFDQKIRIFILERYLFKGPLGNFWGSLNRTTVVRGHTAYAGWGTSLAVIDISHVEKPALLKKFLLKGIVHGLLLDKNLLFVAAGTPGLFIYDISRPRDPVLLSRFFSDGYGMSVARKENVLYYCDEKNGLLVLDIKNIRRPELIKHFREGYANAVIVRGNTAFLSDGKRGLVLMDVSRPEKPRVLSILKLAYEGVPHPLDPPPLWTDVKDGFAYVAMGPDGIVVADVRNLKKPRVLAKLPLHGFTYTVMVNGNIAYAADILRGLVTLNIETPEKPRIVSAARTPGNAFDIFLYDNKQKAAVSDGANGLVLLALTQTRQPERLGSITPRPIYRSVKIYKNFLYVLTGSGGVDAYDISKDKPARTAHLDTIGFASRITFHDDRAYVADVLGGVTVLDVKNPARPKPLKIFDIEEHPWGIDAFGHFLAIANAHHGLVLFDVHSAQKPVYLSKWETGHYSVDVRVQKPYAYMTDLMGGFLIFDISDMRHPVKKSAVPMQCLSLDVEKNIAYVAAYNKGLLIFDVKNPAQPQLLGKLKTGGYVYGVDVTGNTAYIADYEKGLVVADVSESSAPQIQHVYKTRGNPHGVAVYHGKVYVADGETGLTTIDVATGKLF